LSTIVPIRFYQVKLTDLESDKNHLQEIANKFGVSQNQVEREQGKEPTAKLELGEMLFIKLV